MIGIRDQLHLDIKEEIMPIESVKDKPILLEVTEERRNKCKVGLFLCNYKGCKNTFKTKLYNVKSGNTKSCGCARKNINIKHGGRYKQEYGIWLAIKKRCLSQNCKDYHYYGGRGIKICEQWIDNFAQFYLDMGPRPSNQHELERRENDGNYEPSNCYWATKKEQKNNTRHNRFITYKDRTLTLAQWAEELGTTQQTLSARINTYKWSIEKAIETPIRKIKND